MIQPLSNAVNWRTLIRQSALPVLVSLAFIAAIVINPALDLARLGELLRSANPVWLIPAAVIFFIGVVVRAIRWRVLLSHVADVPVRACYNVLLIGFMANNVLPFRTGELVRAQALYDRLGVSRTATLATILAERICDATTLLLFIAVSVLLMPVSENLVKLATAGSTVLVLAVVATAVMTFGGPLIAQLVGRLPGQFGIRLSNLVLMFAHGLDSFRRPLDLLYIIVTSIVAWFIEAIVLTLVLGAFGLPPSILHGLLITATSTLATTVPSTQGGIGPFEFAAAQTLVELGVDQTIATGYAIVAHAVILVPVIPIGLVLLWRNRTAAKQTPMVNSA